MARNTEEIERLEQKLNNTRLQLKQTKQDLSERIEVMDRELSDLLSYFDLSIIETRADMKIINSYGNAEVMFKPAKKMLERGGNLIKAVYKTTRNTKARSDSGIEDYEELEDLEYTVGKFIDSNRNEKTIHVIGENDSGEIFLLIWIIVKKEKIFKSYFRVIPTNQIIRETKKRYEKEIKDIRRNARDIYELISDGITILDIDGRILYMNTNANKGFLPNDNKLLESASFEGRLFSGNIRN
jgi:PAS domain-containing protein